jgi:dynein heavy chain
MDKYVEELTNWAALFEVPVGEFRGLKNCRRETIMIKQLWDYSYVIRSSVDNWKTTHWKEIDVERMEIECKHFAKNIRGLDKELRAWDAYIGLDASVRDLLTSLKVLYYICIMFHEFLITVYNLKFLGDFGIAKSCCSRTSLGSTNRSY